MGLHMFSFGETPFDVSLEGKLDKSGSFDGPSGQKRAHRKISQLCPRSDQAQTCRRNEAHPVAVAIMPTLYVAKP